MVDKDLITYAPNTWCPGCGNFAISSAIRGVLGMLKESDFPLEKVVLVSGIGCHAKIVDYIKVNSFYSIHGRVTPVAEGIKIADPDIKVIGFAGDGDAYGEGLEHLVFAAKRNIDISMIIHNNRVYGLTTGQYTPTSPLGFKGRSTPSGSKEYPLNPLELMLASGATFVARGYSHGLDFLKRVFWQAISHRGFSLVDVLQVCKTYFDMYDYYTERVYELKEHNAQNYNDALNKMKEWDYSSDAPIALGTFYKKEAPTFETSMPEGKAKEVNRDLGIRELLKQYI